MRILMLIRAKNGFHQLHIHFVALQVFCWKDTMPEFATYHFLLKPGWKWKASKRTEIKWGSPVFPIDWKNQENERRRWFPRTRLLYQMAFLNSLAFWAGIPGMIERFSMKKFDEPFFDPKRIGKSGTKFLTLLSGKNLVPQWAVHLSRCPFAEFLAGNFLKLLNASRPSRTPKYSTEKAKDDVFNFLKEKKRV